MRFAANAAKRISYTVDKTTGFRQLGESFDLRACACSFLKSLRGGGREALLALRRGRNESRRFLFVNFFFCAYGVKRKSGYVIYGFYN